MVGCIMLYTTRQSNSNSKTMVTSMHASGTGKIASPLQQAHFSKKTVAVADIQQLCAVPTCQPLCSHGHAPGVCHSHNAAVEGQCNCTLPDQVAVLMKYVSCLVALHCPPSSSRLQHVNGTCSVTGAHYTTLPC